MIAIILATEAGTGNFLFDVLGSFGRLHKDSPVRMTVGDGPRWLMLTQTETVLNEYEPDQLIEFKKILHDPEFYVIQARDSAMLKNFIDRIADEKTVVIDNGHGLIDTLPVFKRYISEKNDWLYYPDGI